MRHQREQRRSCPGTRCAGRMQNGVVGRGEPSAMRTVRGAAGNDHAKRHYLLPREMETSLRPGMGPRSAPTDAGAAASRRQARDTLWNHVATGHAIRSVGAPARVQPRSWLRGPDRRWLAGCWQRGRGRGCGDRWSRCGRRRHVSVGRDGTGWLRGKDRWRRELSALVHVPGERLVHVRRGQWLAHHLQGQLRLSRDVSKWVVHRELRRERGLLRDRAERHVR